MDQNDAPEAGEEGHEETEPAAQPWRGPQIKPNKLGGFGSEYRGWRDAVQAIVKLHWVPEDKLLLLLYLAREAEKSLVICFRPTRSTRSRLSTRQTFGNV